MNLATKLILFLAVYGSLYSNTKYVLKCDKYLLYESRKVLIKQVGVKEATGNNDGIQVERYLASVGLKKGNPYCQAGQYYCFLQVGKPPIPKSGLAISSFNYARTFNNKVAFVPSIDDLLIWNKPNTIFGHIERIVEVGSKGWVYTVGFNTASGSKGNQRDGGGVYRRKRNIYYPLGRSLIKGLVGWKQ